MGFLHNPGCFMLSERIFEFLLFGPFMWGNESEKDTSQKKLSEDLRQESNNFISEWNSVNGEKKKVSSQISRVCAEVSRAKLIYDDAAVVELLLEHKHADNKIQLLVLAQTLQNLNSFSSVSDVPDLVLNVLENLPKYLPSESKINIHMLEVVNRLRRNFLESFHHKFEEHLNESLTNNDAKVLWINFLVDARDWLLAYAVLSLLPTVLSESRSLVLDKYQETLDEMLTPLWSRFHFHLTEAHSGESLEQVLWTFGYAQSFIQMMSDLCSQITSSGKLQQIEPGDYKRAGVQHVTEKAVRFMRYHVAKVIVKHSPLSASTCVLIVEQCFQLDAFADTLFPQSLTLSAVVYDSHEMFALWVDAERRHFVEAVSQALRSMDLAYSPAFEETRTTSDFSVQPDWFSASSTRSSPSLICYRGVYECMCRFVTACERYQFLPPPAQHMLSDVVLEPLLAVCVCIFLLRLRSEPTLHMISKNTLAPSVAKSVLDGKYDNPLDDFAASARYFQKCLGSLPPVHKHLTTHPQRFEKRWSTLQSWLPKRQLTSNEVGPGGSFSFDEVIARAFVCREAQEAHYRSVGVGPQGAREGAGQLGEAIDLVRAQALTLASVLDRQLKKLAQMAK